MKNKKKIMILLFVLSLFVINIMCESITNGIIERAYRPYKGVVVALDAGHGGIDDGARYDGVNEQEINLSIVKLLHDELKQVGIKVILTRKGNYDLASDKAKSRKKEDLKKRVAIINDKKVDFFISIHMNAYANSNAKGSQIFYEKGDEDSKKFAEKIQEEIGNVTNSNKEIKTGDYYILKNTNKIGILLECGFLSNAQDRNKLVDKKYQRTLSKAIKKGVLSFLQEIYE